MKISVIVTNWNGVNLLKKYLENVIINSPEASEIILADDASEDNSIEFVRSLQKKYPQLEIISHHQNHGFGYNTNFAVKKASGDLVALLNNDINPHPNYLKNCLRHFRDPRVLGVGFSEQNHENYGSLYWENGYYQIRPAYSNHSHITAWVSGGSSLICRQFFLELGGFDPVYAPFYFEDLDLGFRAWQSGYKLIWEPTAIVEHRHESTMSKFSKNLLTYVKERNHLIFTRRNTTDSNLHFKNKIASLLRVISGPNYLKIILAANRQQKKYPHQTCDHRLSDQQILDLFK